MDFSNKVCIPSAFVFQTTTYQTLLKLSPLPCQMFWLHYTFATHMHCLGCMQTFVVGWSCHLRPSLWMEKCLDLPVVKVKEWSFSTYLWRNHLVANDSLHSQLHPHLHLFLLWHKGQWCQVCPHLQNLKCPKHLSYNHPKNQW